MKANAGQGDPLLIVGSIAYDSVQTPHGKRDRALGGAATYAGMAASYFAPVKLIGVIGEDFEDSHLDLLKSKGIDISGVKREKGKTFFWAGKYSEDLNERETLDTQLNVFETFSPELLPGHRDCKWLFLANIDPDIQRAVLEQCPDVAFSALDTMNLWIDIKRDSLVETISLVDGLMINDGEAKQLCGTGSLPKAASEILSWGPRFVVIKKGEHGLLLFTRDHRFALPAMPLEEAADPTGAGDTFAGAFMGFLAGRGVLDADSLNQAAVAGTLMASFCVQDFSLDAIANLTDEAIRGRYGDFRRITSYPDLAI